MSKRGRGQTRTTARSSAAALLAGLTLLLAPAGSAAEAPGVTANGAAGGVVVATLSNLRTLSRWAYPQAAAAVRQQPSARARVIDRLHLLTIDGQAEVYLALRSYTVSSIAHPSHGCIRLRNADIARLWNVIKVGTPIEIV